MSAVKNGGGLDSFQVFEKVTSVGSLDLSGVDYDDYDRERHNTVTAGDYKGRWANSPANDSKHSIEPASVDSSWVGSPILHASGRMSLDSIDSRDSKDSKRGIKRVTVEVTLIRDGKPLGLQVVGGTDTVKSVYIRSVKEGGVAALNGGVKRGDRLLEVNGISVQETSHEGVLRLLKQAENEVHLKLERRRRLRGKASRESLISTSGTSYLGSLSEISADDDLQVESITTRKCGWLVKQGGGPHLGGDGGGGFFGARKNWKRRWFVLQDTMMKYYKTIPNDGGCHSPQGYLNLDSTTELIRTDDFNFLVITSKRKFHFRADSKSEVDDWVRVIKTIITKF